MENVKVTVESKENCVRVLDVEVPAEEVTLALGSQLHQETIQGRRVVAIGQCAIDALKKKGQELEALKGCPPSEAQQREFLKKWLKNAKD